MTEEKQQILNKLCKVNSVKQTTAIVKWCIRAKVKVSLCNGGDCTWHTTGEAIIIRRVDVEKVHDYARAHATLEDYLTFRVPMKIGLRSTEMTTLKREDIDFDNLSFQVLDSKKHKYFWVPLDVLTLQLMQDLTGSRLKGYVFTQTRSWKKTKRDMPITRAAIWRRITRISKEAGVPGVTPRLLRHYCAAHLYYVEHKKPNTIQKILRHKNPTMLHIYLARLSFFEDVQEDFQRTQNPYVMPQSPQQQKTTPLLTDFYREWCSRCEHEPVCRIIDQMCASPGATGCRFYKQKKEMIKKHEV
jgi:hypothetical protein